MRHIGIAGTLAALAMVTAGCGSAPPTTSGAVPDSAGGSHLSMAQFIPTVTQAVAGARSVHTELRSARGQKKTVADADVSFTSLGSLRMTYTDELGVFNSPSSVETEIRLLERQAFIKGKGTSGKYAVIQGDSSRSINARALRQMRADMNPTQDLAPLRKGMTKLTYLGLVAGDGLYMGHYRATVNAKRAFGIAAKSQASATFTCDVLLDAENRPRRLTYEVNGLSVDISYADWGKRIRVDKPGPKERLTS